MIKCAGILLFASVMLLLLVIPFSGEASQLGTPDSGVQQVRIGVLARRGFEECLQSWGPTAEYLGRKIEDFHFQIVPLSFEEVVPRVQAKDVDFVVVNSSIYVELKALFGVAPIATMKDAAVDHDSTVFGGVIFTRADRLDLETIGDLKNKSFMGVDETSLGGWRAVWREFKAKRIDPYKNFSRLLFSGTHDAVVYAVRDGKVDAGTVATSILEQMTTEGKIESGLLKVINAQENADFPYAHSTRLYPNWPFAKLKHTSNALAEKIVIALLSMPHDSPAAIASEAGGWTVPLDYGSVDECLRELHIGIYKDFGKITVADVLHNYKWQIAVVMLAIMGLTGLLVVALRFNHDLRTSKLALQNQIYGREHAEAALKRIREQYELILLSAGEGILGIDPEGKVTFANPAAGAMLGYEEEELIGKDLHPMIHHSFPDGTHYAVAECPMWQCLRNGAGSRIRDEVLWKKDGTNFPTAYSCAPIMEDGQVIGAVVTFRDISVRKNAEKALHESELRLRTILQTVNEGFWLIDNDTAIMDLNPRMCAIMGGNREEILGRKIFDFVDSENKAIFEQQIRLRSQGQVGTYEIALSRPDGSNVSCQFSATPLLDGSGNKVGSFAMVTDISERKLTEDALRHSEAKYRELFAAVSDAILVFDADTLQFIDMNESALRCYGYTREEFLDLKATDVTADPEISRKSIEETVAKQHLRIPLRYHRKKDGTEFPVEISAVRFLLRERTLLCGVVRDITERKLAEEEKAMLEAQLLQAQKLEAIGTLAGGIAHDFNNILVPIIGYTEMALSEMPQPSPITDRLERILNAAIRARDLIKQILAFGRSGKEQQQTPVEVGSIVKEALKLLSGSLPSSIEIRQEIENGVALADSTQIHQILINLCTNAAHAMGDKGILEVRLSRVDLNKSDLADQSIVALKPGQYLKLSISDTGCGMDARTLERIFEPYFTTREVGKGSGLGLAVVHGIVKRHEGTITVQSEPGKGTIFCIYIPATEASIDPIVETGQVLPRGTERILLVDDEQSVIEMETAIFERLGYDVTPETDSPRALEIFRTRPGEFDLIITDYTMPNLTGIDLSKEIRRIQRDIPIILCTGFSEKVTEKGSLDLGVELAMKPFGMKQIAELVRKVLS